MPEAKWERLAAWAGLIFVAFFFAALSDPVVDPTGDGESVVAAQLLDHRVRAQLAAYAGGLAAVALVWFVGSLRSTLRRAEGGTGRLSAVAFGGGVMAGATLLASSTFLSAAISLADYGDDPTGARLAAGFSEHLFFATSFGMALLVGATFLLALRHEAIPIGLASVGAAGGGLFLIPIWPLFVFGFFIVQFWVAALSVFLIRRSAPLDKT